METFRGVFCAVFPLNNSYSRHWGSLLFPLPAHGASFSAGGLAIVVRKGKGYSLISAKPSDELKQSHSLSRGILSKHPLLPLSPGRKNMRA